jgi:hypothetical protein
VSKWDANRILKSWIDRGIPILVQTEFGTRWFKRVVLVHLLNLSSNLAKTPEHELSRICSQVIDRTKVGMGNLVL